MSGARKVLIVSPVPTHPPSRGNRQRILQIAELFRDSGYSFELAVGENQAITSEAHYFWPKIHRIRHSPGWKPSHKNAPFDSWYTEGLGEEIASITEKSGANIVFLNYVFHSKLLTHLPKSIVKVIDCHDIFANRHELYGGKKLAGGFFSCTKEDEARYLSRADAIIAITQEEGEYFRKLKSTAEVFVVPFAAKKVERQRRSLPRDDPALHFGVVMSANDLNLQGLSNFISAIDKRFGRRPPFRVSVAGDINRFAYFYFPHRRFAFARPWLKYQGQVGNIDNFYRSLDAAIVPVVRGTGMAIKFGEAIAKGMPTISTAVGSRGYSKTHPLHRLQNNEEVAFTLGGIVPEDLASLAESSDTCQRQAETNARRQWNGFLGFISSEEQHQISQ